MCKEFETPPGCGIDCHTNIAFFPPTAMITVPQGSGPPLLLEAATTFSSGTFYDGGSLTYFDPTSGNTRSAFLDQDPLTLTAGDLFGDGGLEIAVMEATQVQLLLMGSDGGFFDAGAVPLPSSGYGEVDCNYSAQLVFADINGDGAPDLVAFCAPTLAAAFGPSLASFTSLSTTAVCSGATSLAVGSSLDGERFAFNCETNEAENNPTEADVQVFATQSLAEPLLAYRSGLQNTYPDAQTYFGDLNGDGLPDLLLLDSDVSDGGGVAVLYAVADGGYAPGPTVVQPFAVQFFGAAFGDLNGDGRTDVAIYALVDGELPYPDGGSAMYPTCLEAMLSFVDGGLSPPVLVDMTSTGIGYPENTPGPAITVGNYLSSSLDQIAILDTAGDVVVVQAVCNLH